jgi:2-phospho-L-lactate guanylyltransferase
MTATRIGMPESVGARRSIPPVRDELRSTGLVVPVKAFTRAKQRLSPALDAGNRHRLARYCAGRVLAAAGPLPVYVVCDDDEVAAWAAEAGAHVIWTVGLGLNPAMEASLVVLAEAGITMAVIAHGDLPLARRFDHVALAGSVCAVPDHRYDGTNVLAVPTALADRFRFQYGSGSFRRHVQEALRLGSPVRILRDEDLAHDLDTPHDLADPRMEDVRQWLRTNPDNPR